MVSHGIISAALFLCVGVIYERMHTREIKKYGGIVDVMPKYSIVLMIFTLGALGLPGTTGFVGEFLILMGAFKDNFLVAVIASFGVILGAAYMLWLYKRVVFGEIINKDLKNLIDLNKSEFIILPFSVYATFLISKFFSSILSGLTTGITPRLYSLAKSKSLWSWAGQPKIEPRPYSFKTKLAT